MEAGVFICLFCILMSVMFLATSISSHIDRSNANTKVTAKVTGYEFTTYGEDEKMYVPTIEYEYKNKEYRVMLDITSMEKDCVETRYPIGSELEVYICRDKPRFATVNEKRGGDAFSIICSIVFFCFVIAALIKVV